MKRPRQVDAQSALDAACTRAALAGSQLGAAEAAALEQTLRRTPADIGRRARLLGHYMPLFYQPEAARRRQARQRALVHALWFVKNHPSLPFSASPHAQPPGPRERRATPAQALMDLWRRQVRQPRPDVRILVNAARFFALPHRATAIRLWQRAIRRAPRDAGLRYSLAHARLLGKATRASARLALADLERALALTRRPQDRARFLEAAAEAGRRAGLWDKTRRFARALSSGPLLSKLDVSDRSDAVHAAHQELGRLALGGGRIEEAVSHLLRSADVVGSPVLWSFGPRWDLAEALLDGGRRTDVVRYLDCVHAFWKANEPLVDDWKRIIASGAIPDFAMKWKAGRRVGPPRYEVLGE